MSRYLPVIEVILVIWAISDCLQRRQSRAWIFVVLVFPIVGAVLYFAWTRNWFGRISWAMATGWSGGGDGTDVVGEGTPAELQKKGAALVRRGRHDEAVEVLEELLAREGPTVPSEARYDIAMAYKTLGRYRDARDQLSLIVGDDAKFHAGQAFLELADCHYQMKDQEQALKLFEQLLRIVRFPEARYKYGILLDQADRVNEAAEQMKLLLHEMDSAPEFHRDNNRRYAKSAREYLEKKKEQF
jgi:tetratricopeptide (TPR) repeat protein